MSFLYTKTYNTKILLPYVQYVCGCVGVWAYGCPFNAYIMHAYVAPNIFIYAYLIWILLVMAQAEQLF